MDSSERSTNKPKQFTPEKELEFYMAEPLSTSATNVGEFSLRERLTFPRLSKLAFKHLSAPPATVFSERLFSTSDIICDKKRKRLNPEKVQKRVFLNKNLRHHPDYVK